MATMNRSGDTQERYLELVRQFSLRPIRSDKELDEAVRMIDALLNRHDLTPEEDDYLEVLGDLVERYETEVHPMTPVSDAEMLRHLLEAKGVGRTELCAVTGIAESTISGVLKGRRSLNRDHIGKLARYFKVSPNVFAF